MEDKITTTKNSVFHESAGGYLFSEDKGKLYVALLEKTDGKYFIPKGHIKRNETPEEAALREIKEELSLEESPTKVAKVGIVKYSFGQLNDNREHVREVHIYVYSVPSKVGIKPLREEDYVNAEWFEIDEALRKLEYEKNTFCEAVSLYKSYKVLSSHIKKIKNCFKSKLGDNLLAIIDSGSISSGGYKPNWSDIDLLLVVKNLNLETKLKIADVAEELKNILNTEIGLNVISQEEYSSPKFPVTRLEGKTLQTLVELSLNPKRVIYTNNKLRKAYLPTRKQIKAYSLSNVALFVFLNRKAVTAASISDESRFKKVTEKQVRYAFIMMKLALQYFEGKIYETKTDMLKVAKLCFDDFDFSPIQEVFEKTKKWEKVKGKKSLKEVLKIADDFIENFSEYFFLKAKINHLDEKQ